MCLAVVLLVSATPAIAQEHGDSGGGGCGDVFGDLIHILRHDVTGQPILAQRWIELPAEVPGYGWGYCVIPVDEDGYELRFMDLSCDVHEDDLEFVVETNYFGRLNGGRTKPRNNRMHFDEVISSIKTADHVHKGPAGRLMLGYDSEEMPGGIEWATVDSPMESMGLYVRLIKFGHFQTDPFEVDLWSHGDPKLPVQYHPALGPEDYDKFWGSVKELLPNKVKDAWDCFFDVNGNGIWEPTEPYTDLGTEDYPDGNGYYDLGEPFMDINFNGVRDDGGDTFVCGDDPVAGTTLAQDLGNRDFVRGAAFLAASASKTGKVTWDLVQYWNRILKVTKKNPYTGPSPLNTLPAQVRVCEIGAGWVGVADDEDQVEPPYDYDDCTISDVTFVDGKCDTNDFANCELFLDVQERFVDFFGLGGEDDEGYERDGEDIDALEKSTSDEQIWLADDVSLFEWVEYVNGIGFEERNIAGFVDAASDWLRMIEFIHNYEIPEDLYSTYPPSQD